MSETGLQKRIAGEKSKVIKNGPAEFHENGPALGYNEINKKDEKEVTIKDEIDENRDEKISFLNIISWNKSLTNSGKSVRKRRSRRKEEKSIPDKNQKTILHFYGNKKNVEMAKMGKRKIENDEKEFIGTPSTPNKKFRGENLQ